MKTKLGVHVRQMAATEAFSPILVVVEKKSCDMGAFEKMGCDTTMVGQTALDSRNVYMGTMREGAGPVRRPLTTQLPPVIKAMPKVCLMAYNGQPHGGPQQDVKAACLCENLGLTLLVSVNRPGSGE